MGKNSAYGLVISRILLYINKIKYIYTAYIAYKLNINVEISLFAVDIGASFSAKNLTVFVTLFPMKFSVFLSRGLCAAIP